MAIRYWKKMREEGAKHAEDPRAPAGNPWVDDRPTLAQLSTTYAPNALENDGDRAARYNDWAERMHEKRRRLHNDKAGEPTPSYWTTDALFEDSRRVEDAENEQRPNPWRVKELLALFDLREGATTADIGNAYRRLAKQHHPDRFLDADEATQTFHAERMRDIISAYRTLKHLEQV